MDKLYNQLVLFRNNLKFKTIYDFQLIGILSELCFNNVIEHKELKDLICNSYNVETEVNDVTRLYFCLLNKFKKEDLAKEKEIFRKNLYKWVSEKIDTIKKENNIKEKKDMLDGWIK